MKAATSMINPVLILEQIPESDISARPNPYGYGTIRIWQFNFDGRGTALVSYDDDAELDSCSDEDLQYILFGNPENGHRWYSPTNLNIAGTLSD